MLFQELICGVLGCGVDYIGSDLCCGCGCVWRVCGSMDGYSDVLGYWLGCGCCCFPCLSFCFCFTGSILDTGAKTCCARLVWHYLTCGLLRCKIEVQERECVWRLCCCVPLIELGLNSFGAFPRW